MAKTCTRCIHTPGLDVDIRWIAESTPLVELQDIFNKVVTVSLISKYGYSLTSLDTYLRHKNELPTDIDTMFLVFGRLLTDKNNRYISQMESRLRRGK